MPISTESRPRWRRRLSVALRRTRLVPAFEILTIFLLVGVLGLSYWLTSSSTAAEGPLTPPLVAGLLVANLVPAMGLMVLLARRVAKARAAKSDLGGRGRLHVRLVALFSVIASLPTLLVVIFASILFQSGMQFWFSDRARVVLGSAESVAQIYEAEHRERMQRDLEAMGVDMVDRINRYGLDSNVFEDDFWYQTAARQLTETAILSVTPESEIQMRIGVNLDDRPLERRFPVDILRRLRAGEISTAVVTPDRVEAVIRLDPEAFIYLYAAREINASAIGAIDQARSAASDYQATLDRSRNLQFRFNAALLGVSLLIVGLSIWVALALADRLVRPVSALVGAAHRITAGDLTARVPDSKVKDEIATLGNAFNRMTRRLEAQTGALMEANSQLDHRRAFTEAVLAGVTAGVISVDSDHVVRLINSSAEALLKTGGSSPLGQRLADVAPELDAQIGRGEPDGIIQFSSGGEPRTLAVKTVVVDNGHVLTFDDITEQLLDQRRAAWSDVARRIAHEIKNPLTPIQLAAERLQRRYGKEITSDSATFERLTGTIVRQVGDLRRMVDEFSSFARMPKPVFREEAVTEIARQALFLHEVAHPDIAFALDAPTPSPMLVCDRRLLGQAFTNIVKNGVEAIEQKREESGNAGADRIAIEISRQDVFLCIAISDSGIGLPADRQRLTEPYTTTRPKGTGLGLAIVKKIVEEHFGRIEFEDGANGGSIVRMLFDTEALARLGVFTHHNEDNNVSG